MTLTLQVIDNFYLDPWYVREFALGMEFIDAQSEQDQRFYKGMLTSPFHFFAKIGLENLSRAIGGKAVCRRPVGDFRLLLSASESVGSEQTWVHSDTSASCFSAIVYLNPPDQCRGGTAFYRHREFGIEQMPDTNSHSLTWLLQNTRMSFDEVLDVLTVDGFDVDGKWDLVMNIPMRFNWTCHGLIPPRVLI